MTEFQITSGKIVASDPCYTIPTWCQGIVENVKNGTWLANVEIVDAGTWGRRIGRLFIANKEAYNKDEIIGDRLFSELPMNIDAGVDSGQFGFFDFDHYRNDESAKDLEKYSFGENYDQETGDSWYRACANITLADESWGALPHGAVSSSGYGDGSYEVFGLKDADGQYIALGVVYIGEDENDEDDDNYDEDEETCENCGEHLFDCECRGETIEDLFKI